MKKSIWLRCLSAALVLIMMASALGCQQTKTVTSEYYEDDGTSQGSNSNAAGGDEQSQGGDSNVASGDATEPGISNGSPTTKAGSSDPINLKGATVKIAKWGVGGAPQASSPVYKQYVELIKSIEKKYNCKISWVAVADAIQYNGAFTTAAMSGTKFADIVYIPSDLAFPSSALKGYFTALDKYVNLKSTQWNQKATNEIMNINGKHYFVAPAIDAVSLGGGGIFWNKALFKKFGVKTPYEYMKSNTWNWANFLKTAQALTKQDGGAQYYGLANFGTTGFIASNGITVTKKVNGKMTFNLDNPASIAAIQFVYDMYNKHKVIPTGDGENLWLNGTAAMMVSAYYQGATYMETLGGDNVGFAYYPIGPNMKDYYYFGGSMNIVGIPSAVKNPDVIAKILVDYTALASWRQTPEEAMEKYMGDETALSVAVDQVQRAYTNMQFTSYYPWFHQKVLWADFGIKSQTSPQSYIASIKNASQDDINGVWGVK